MDISLRELDSILWNAVVVMRGIRDQAQTEYDLAQEKYKQAQHEYAQALEEYNRVRK